MNVLASMKGIAMDENSVLSASEALYGFCGWLTTRKEVVQMGSSSDCAHICELIERFIDRNNLECPREGWQHLIVSAGKHERNE